MRVMRVTSLITHGHRFNIEMEDRYRNGGSHHTDEISIIH